jgi:hypothetical protein
MALTIEEEFIVIGFRRHTLLPLDECLYALQSNDPASGPLCAVTGSRVCCRSARHTSYFHIDIAEVHTEEGKLYHFVAIDRTARSLPSSDCASLATGPTRLLQAARRAEPF